jgi:hypothetical protein
MRGITPRSPERALNSLLYLLLKTIAELLGRSPQTIRTHYIEEMLSQGLLQLRYPEQISHPQQAYTTVSLSTKEINGVSDTPPFPPTR